MDAPSVQPEACTADQDCRTLNARCYPTWSSDAIPAAQIPVNNSLYCYCNLVYSWMGPECSQLSSKSIGLGVSNLAIGVIALVLAIVVVLDITNLWSYLERDARRIGADVHAGARSRSPANRPIKRSIAFSSCFGSDTRNRMDMHMVTSIMLFLALVTLLGFTLVDTISNWMLQTCMSQDGVRQNCLIVLNGIFVTSSPIFWISLMLLLSALMYNAGFKANGMSTLPFASFWTLIVLDTILCATLVASAVLNDKTIASFSGACFVLIAGVVNGMTCYRLRDFTFIKLLVRCQCGRLNGCGAVEEGRRNWTIKQRLMAICMTVCFLDCLITIILILRGTFLTFHTAQGFRIAVVSDKIFLWAYLGVLIVYFTLIHYNSKERVNYIAQKLLPSPQADEQRTHLDASELDGSRQPSVHQSQTDPQDQARSVQNEHVDARPSSPEPTTSKERPNVQVQLV